MTKLGDGDNYKEIVKRLGNLEWKNIVPFNYGKGHQGADNYEKTVLRKKIPQLIRVTSNRRVNIQQGTGDVSMIVNIFKAG